MINKVKVFVYGTLMKGYKNHRLIDSQKTSKFLGKGVTQDNIFTMIDLVNFPGVIEKGVTNIVGEIYEIDLNTLQSLDYLEGHPNFYRRKVVNIINKKKVEEVNMYILNSSYNERSSNFDIIKSGNYKLKNLK
jgi:gamma-glutamylcyclotransferase (GGCT)/AIG2-like uncharacterized protein YtfP